MASVAVATIPPSCSAHRSPSVSPSPSSVLRQASLQPLCSKAKMDALREATMPSCLSSVLVAVLSRKECNLIVTHAVAEALREESSGKAEEGAPVNELSKLQLESDLLKKKAKRAELRRKRLVRKRHLRKKGRWPPSKMAKLKNV
ncbi:hypothetical protein GOP47_0011018 [Adiantum capillus-veneris]|uniref:50S ribosomal protein 5, chloroplastic n=1 Tax=Adiantum capillus-veneris TaxID=13818 RepID=A0A9D4UX81_ADICA|nr:hypothetical protein GOP47_0010729 [Adiantum capillus-veneris]KAI5075057.1 hypothetical protein GOP47_0011018 [Adiantum capillus-veneris]